MPVYYALRDTVNLNNTDDINALLVSLCLAERVGLFGIAMHSNDFLVMDALLQREPDLNSNLGLFLDVAAELHYPVDILAMLVDYGADLTRTVGDITLLELISQRDQAVALFLASEANILQSLRSAFTPKALEPYLQELQPKDARSTLIDSFTKKVHSAKVSNATHLWIALTNLRELQKKIEPIFALTQQLDASLNTETLRGIKEEVGFAYSLYFEFPYYSRHALNFMVRIKKYTQLTSLGPDSSLTRSLKTIIDDYDNASLSDTSMQDWLIQPTEMIKEQSDVKLENINGQCFGFAYMVMQAMVVGDLPICKERIEWLQTIPFEQLNELLQTNRRRMLRDHHQAKEFNLSLQPSNRELNYLELEGFIQGVAFAQSPEFHPEYNIHAQHVLDIAPILMSKKLEAEGGLVQIKNFTRYYDHAGLLTYLQTIREVINAASLHCDYVSLFLTCPGHTIVIGYDINRYQWIFCDANAVPQIQEIDSDWLLAIKIMSAFSLGLRLNTISKIETRVYSTQNQEKRVGELFAQWERHPRLNAIYNASRQQSLHGAGPIFPALIDSLQLAIISDNLSLVSFAFKQGDINTIELVTWVRQISLGKRSLFLQQISIETLVQLVHAAFVMTDIIDLLPLDAVGPFVQRLFLGPHLSWVKDLDDLRRVAILLPKERRYIFFQQDSIQALLVQWISDFQTVIRITKLLLEEHVGFFLQLTRIQDNLSRWIVTHWDLGVVIKLLRREYVAPFLNNHMSDEMLAKFIPGQLYFILLALPPQDIAPFLQRKIVQDNLFRHIDGARSLANIVSCMPDELIDGFLQQKTIQENLLSWLSDPEDLCFFIVILPLEKIGSLIARRGISQLLDLEQEIKVLLKCLNNKHQDVLIECLISMPQYLKTINNGLKVYELFEDTNLQIDRDVFIENIVRVFQIQEKTSEGVLAKIKQFEDQPWLYATFIQVNQDLQKLIQPSPRSILQQNSFFTGHSRNQEWVVSLEPNHTKRFG